MLMLALGAVGLSVGLHAQPVFTGVEIFPPDEFAARRARVLEAIGDGVAVLQGTHGASRRATAAPEQSVLLSDRRCRAACAGNCRRTHETDNASILEPATERRRRQIDRMYGTGLVPGPEAAAATGVDAVLSRDAFASAVQAIGGEGRTIFTPFRPEVLGCASASDAIALASARKADPWDGRPSREEAFIARLKSEAPRSDLQDLDPILDRLRSIKSARARSP